MAKLNVVLRDSGGNSKAGYRVAVYNDSDVLVADTNHGPSSMIDNGDGSYISAEEMDPGEYTVKYATTPSGTLAVVPGYEAFSFGSVFSGIANIPNGGTGATTVSGAQQNLGVEPGVDVLEFDNRFEVMKTTADSYGALGDYGVCVSINTVDGYGKASFGFVDEDAFKAYINLEPGVDVQEWSQVLDDFAAITMPTGPLVKFPIAGLSGWFGIEAPTARAFLGLGSVATESTVPINKGGTGAATAEQAREELGLEIDRDVQRWSASLDAFAAAFERPAESPAFLASENGGIEAKSTAQMRTLLGIGNAGLEDVVPILYGGTGATTASNARAALGLGAVATETVLPIDKGGTGASSKAAARAALGLGSVATETSVPVAMGGTGATGVAGARENLGLEIGADVQEWSSGLDDIVAIIDNPTYNPSFIAISEGEVTEYKDEAFRGALGLGEVATVDVVPIENGGTSAISASLAREALGLEIDVDVQAHDSHLDKLVRAADDVSIYPSLVAVIDGGPSGNEISTLKPSEVIDALSLGTAATEDTTTSGENNKIPVFTDSMMRLPILAVAPTAGPGNYGSLFYLSTGNEATGSTGLYIIERYSVDGLYKYRNTPIFETSWSGNPQ